MNESNPWEMARRIPSHVLDQWWAFWRRRDKRIKAEAERRRKNL